MSRSRTYFSVIAVSLLIAGIAGAQQQPWGSNAIGEQPIITEGSSPIQDGEPGVDDLRPINQPDFQYTCRTTIFDVTVPDFTIVSSLTAGGCTVTFSPAVQARTVPGSWATWGSPPDTEGATGRVLYTQGATSLTMMLSAGCASQTFGFEAEPNPFAVHTMTANFFAGAMSLGSISRDVSGSAGARLFAADSDVPIDRVVFSSTADFAVARVRYMLPMGGAIVTGYVLDADGNGIVGARVRARGYFSMSEWTDATGRYEIQVAPGMYDVEASNFGYVTDIVPNVELSGDVPSTELDFRLMEDPRRL